jgi:hypothetical protein
MRSVPGKRTVETNSRWRCGGPAETRTVAADDRPPKGMNLPEVLLTSVETASLQQRAAPSLTPPTARRHSRLKELSEVSPTSAPSAEITFHPGSMTFQETFVGSSLLASSSAPRERRRRGWAAVLSAPHEGAPQAAARTAAAARSGLGRASGVHCGATDTMRGCATGLPHPYRPAQ